MQRLFLLCCLALSACSRPVETGAPGQAALQEGRGAFLAYEHSLAIDTGSARVGLLAEQLIAACHADRENSCTLLESTSAQGRDPSAQVKFRARPAGIAKLVALARSGGTLQRQQVHVDDLAKSIVDSNKRLDMLTAYERKLQQLEGKAGNSVDAMMKLSKELATVQSELEQAMGQNAHLLQRVNLDLLSIQIDARQQRGFWSPIGSALADFTSNLSQGLSHLITGLAFILPCLFALLAAWLAGRKLWRAIKGK